MTVGRKDFQLIDFVCIHNFKKEESFTLQCRSVRSIFYCPTGFRQDVLMCRHLRLSQNFLLNQKDYISCNSQRAARLQKRSFGSTKTFSGTPRLQYRPATVRMASTNPSSPWMYFLAGALLPTLAIVLLRKPFKVDLEQSQKHVDNHDDNDDDDEFDDDDEDMEHLMTGGPSSKWGRLDAPYKMVLCVNQELSMGKGKVAAQCCHAAVGCYKRASKQCPVALRAWEVSGCAKIALKCPTQDELELIAAKAMERDIPFYLVEDAGRTQIAAGSRTVLGLGPAPAYVFEEVTSHLKLM